MLTASALLQYLAWIYLGAAALGIVLALKFAKGVKGKVLAALLVLTLFSYWPVSSYLEVRQKAQIQQEKLNVAMARFEERCKTAGEKIYRTVEDVEGVLLTNVRSERKPGDRSDPNWPDAGLPYEPPGEEFLLTFLFWEHHEDKRNMRGYLNYSPSPLPGYKFVDIKTESGLQRIKLEKPESTKLIFSTVDSKPSRYAIAFENFVDPEDRKLWVAGTKVTVTDTSANEVLAEKIWYSVEPGQGSTDGFRSPWGFARTCPFHLGWSGGSTRFFVDQVLKPKK